MNDRELDPAEALSLARRTRASMAERAASPWWYAPLYGLCTGGMVASQGLPPQIAPLAIAGCLLAVLGVYSAWSQATGLQAYGFQAGRTRWVATALLVVVLALSGGGLWLKHGLGYDWGPLAAGAVTAVVAAVGSRLWDATWRAQLRGGA